MREPISHGDSILANSRPHFDECWYWYSIWGFLVLRMNCPCIAFDWQEYWIHVYVLHIKQC